MNQDKRNSLWLAIQYSVTIIFSLITLKLNLIHYGKDLFGSWILISSLWGFGKALDFGLGTSLVKFVAEYNHKDLSRLKFLVSTCLLLMIILGILIFVIIFGIGQVIYFNTNEIFGVEHFEEIQLIFLILGLSFYLNYITILVKSVFEGMSDFVTPSKISIIYSTMILLSVVVTFLFNLPLLNLAYAFLITSLINFFIYAFSFRIKRVGIQLSLKYLDLSLIKKVFTFSLSIQGAAIFGSLIDPLIKYLIGNFSSIGSVSLYEIARRFVTAISGLFGTTFRTILPKASVLSNKDEFAPFLYNECAKLSRIGITYAGTVFGIGAFIIPIIIQQTFNYDEAVLIFFILAIPESINNFGYAIYNFLIGIGKAFFLVIIQMINILIIGFSVYIGLAIFGNLLGLLGYGLTVVLVNILMILFVRNVVGISIRKYFSLSRVYKLLILLMFLLTAIFLLSNNYLNLYIIIFSLGCLSVIVFINDLKNFSSLIFKKFEFKRDV
jgi:O-antigen/teichoic acid export membrane protein